MPDARWNALIDSVLAGVEPDAEARARLKIRLRENGSLGQMYSCWCQGGDATGIARIIRHLARDVR